MTQHIRVHFCPLPELSDWLIENGQSERAQEVNEIDLTQALEVAEKFQTASKQRLHRAQQAQKKWNHEGWLCNLMFYDWRGCVMNVPWHHRMFLVQLY